MGPRALRVERRTRSPKVWRQRLKSCTHTSVSHGHFSYTFSLRGVQTSRARMAQGVCSAHVTSLHLTFSLVMFHPPSVQSPHGHLDTSFLSAPSLPNCFRSESAGQAHFHSTSCEPKEFDKITSVQTETRRPSMIRTAITSLTSRKSHARTLDCSLFPQC